MAFGRRGTEDGRGEREEKEEGDGAEEGGKAPWVSLDFAYGPLSLLLRPRQLGLASTCDDELTLATVPVLAAGA